MYGTKVEDNGRNEKLLAARRKLKQFQNRRRSTSRSCGGVNENNDRSFGNEAGRSRAEYDDNRGERRYRSQQRQSADEGESGDARPLSECYAGYSTESLAESTASTTKATKAARADRRASAASSRYLETPEPVRISIPPDQQELLLRQQHERQHQQLMGAFYHDEQRSPFQRVRRDSESSDATIHSKQHETELQRDAIQNEYGIMSTSSSTETETPQQQHGSEAIRKPFTDISTRENAGLLSATTETAVHSVDEDSGGRRAVVTLTNEYSPHERGQRSAGGVGPSAPALTAAEPSTTEQHVHEKASSAYNATIPPAGGEQDFQHSALQTALQQRDAVVEQLNVQLQQLHNHYSQLHTAYTNVIQQQQQQQCQNLVGQPGDKIQEIDELRKQIQLHLHTMSVLVDEKTELQSQLRQAMEIANQKHFENEELQGRLKANREHLATLEGEMDTHRVASRNFEDTFRRQASELERLRKESAQWQARATEAQQDRSEMNAKLKVRSREVDDLSAKLKEVEKQLHLKDIYIQQLTGGPGAVQQQQLLTDELEQHRRANADLTVQLESARRSIEQWRWEAAQSQERYDAYVKQLNENVAALSQRLEQSEREKYELQIRCDQVEKHFASTTDASDLADKESRGAATAEDLETLKTILNEFEQGLQAANSKTAELERQLVEKETDVKRLTEALTERDRRVQQLTDQLDEKYQHDDSAKSLLEQLHNEKATVSRAVAQNIELKKQLAELQEKFVSMSEASMENANTLESTERQVETLKETLAQQESDMKLSLEKRENEVSALQEQVKTMAAQTFERSHMEDRIRHYEAVQKHFDVELERSQREIGHLKVENADLTQRLTILNDANKTLQVEMQKVVQQQSDRSEKTGSVARSPSAFEESETTTKSSTSQGDVVGSQDGDEESKRQLMAYEQELTEARRRLQHLTTENAELHRIMEQNAEDENQNTIRVELNQALNRSTTLSNDNERLRQRVHELEAQLAQEKTSEQRPISSVGADIHTYACQHHQENAYGIESIHNSRLRHQNDNNGDDRSSVCSEHNDQRREAVNLEAFEKLKSSMEQLQQRFTKAMNENADLADQNQQLEHLITHLQSETETIGEYITIYQHQRRTIRERLKEKEEYVARLAREKEDMQEKLSELQQLVVRLLRDKGSLRQYAQERPVYGRPPSSPPSIVPRKPRALSQTVVDEVSGSEVSLNSTAGGQDAAVTSAPDETPCDQLAANGNGGVSPTISEDARNVGLSSKQEPLGQQDSLRNSPDMVGINEIFPEFNEDSATAERIMRLLTEMRRPDLVNSLPPVERSLHCKYCTGRLMML